MLSLISTRQRASPRAVSKLEALLPELIVQIAASLDYTDAACLALTNAEMHRHVSEAFRRHQASCSAHFDRLLFALATRLTPGEFVEQLREVSFDSCACHIQTLGRAAARCRSPAQWSFELLAALGAPTVFPFDAADVQALLTTVDFSKIVRFAMLALWLTSHFSFATCTRASIQLLLDASWPSALEKHWHNSEDGASTFTPQMQERMKRAVDDAIDGGVSDGWIIETLCEDEDGNELLIYEIHVDDNDIAGLCWPAAEWRELTGPLIDKGHLSPTDVFRYILPRFSMAVQRAVFSVEYCFALGPVDSRGARTLGTALAELSRAVETEPPFSIGSDVSEVAWWALLWLQHLADEYKPSTSLTVPWAEALVGFLEAFTVGAGVLPYFGAHEGIVWLEGPTTRVVLALNEPEPAVPPHWVLLSDMCALTCKFTARRGFASKLGRCASAASVPYTAVLKIVMLYANTAAEVAGSTRVRGSPGNMALRVSANGVAFLKAWADHSGFPVAASNEERIAVAHCLHNARLQCAAFKRALSGLLCKWSSDLGLDVDEGTALYLLSRAMHKHVSLESGTDACGDDDGDLEVLGDANAWPQEPINMVEQDSMPGGIHRLAHPSISSEALLQRCRNESRPAGSLSDVSQCSVQ